jgi:hypothetical protein
MSKRILPAIAVATFAALGFAVVLHPWTTRGEPSSGDRSAVTVTTAAGTPTQPPHPTGLTETSPAGQTCHGEARVHVQKGTGSGDIAAVAEVDSVATGSQAAVGEQVTGLPPGPFDAWILVFRNANGALQFGYRSCDASGASALPGTGGSP